MFVSTTEAIWRVNILIAIMVGLQYFVFKLRL